MRFPWRRLLAWLIDWATILAWVAVVTAVGVPLYLGGITHYDIGTVASNVVAALLVVVPAVIGLALVEASARHATLGKRVIGLRVVVIGEAQPLRFPRTLLRNTLKIGVPWMIGHAAVYALVQTNGQNRAAIGLAVVAYLLPILYVMMLFVGNGRPLYDRLTRTFVALDSSSR